MAFRKKAGPILKLNPDVLVIPECEHPSKLVFPTRMRQPSSVLWVGNNQHKGLGILAYGNYQLTMRDCHNKDLRTIVPVNIRCDATEYNLFAIWANNPDDADGQYVEQVWKALHHYDILLTNPRTILAGDFNSNTIWDKKRRDGNHSHVVTRLEDRKIFSCYHLHHKKEQGKETHPTLYMYRHKDKPYHIDYCFASEDLTEKIQAVEIGSHRKWTKYSDHVPVIVTFEQTG